MLSPVIKVENLSKQYRLGTVGLGSLNADINRWWQTKILGREDPYFKIGTENNRETAGTTGYVWALKNINFEVRRGEVLGIIGRNGAGKSTLLKLLSRVTGPTTGSIKMKGKVASLLEVGTGFHPELTGRENIFLNGAVLGMTKGEIRSKFNEIVDFAGVEKYIDTPVKRYSSGMYVRLAFAVAAHLEPEILIIDEVLAVGDAEFQKKAIGKMKEVSRSRGRTVLFVSHNMASVQNLCSRAVCLKNGTIDYEGETMETVNYYLSDVKRNADKSLSEIDERRGTGKIKLIDIVALNGNGISRNAFLTGEKMQFKICLDMNGHSGRLKGRVDIGINNHTNLRVAWLSTSVYREYLDGDNDVVIFRLEKLSLVPGLYNVNLYCEVNGEVADWLENVFTFEVISSDYYKTGKTVPAGQGFVFLDYQIVNQ